MQDTDIDRFTRFVIPTLAGRLSMDYRVSGVEIFSDLDFISNIGLSSKIKYIKSNTESATRAEDVIEKYIAMTAEAQETVVFYNPLFPFVSINKIDYLFKRVSGGHANSGLGTYFDSQGLEDISLVKEADKGIFVVIDKSEFLRQGSRIMAPLDTISLSALELVSLRSEEDYELYGLISNSGLA